MVVSPDPEIMLAPSFVIATPFTGALCPSSVDLRAGQFRSFVNSLACGLGNTPTAFLATRLFVGASTAS